MKRLFTTFLCLTLAMAFILSGCGKKEAASSEEKKADSSGTTITMMNIKAEINDQVLALASKYESETGVHVEVITSGPSVDAQAMLKGYYLSDQMPDIVACEAAGFSNWEGLLVDMSDQAWAAKTSGAYVDPEYGTIGFPYTTEAIGLAYNADILSKCGVDPNSITGPDSMRAAFEAVQARKDELGLYAVVDCVVEPENLGWSAGNHIFGTYIDSGLDRDDTTYIDQIAENKQVDPSRFEHFAEMVSLLYQYSNPETLTTGTYDDEVGGFAAGKYAFVTQGSWIGASMTSSEDYKAAGSFEVGMVPYAFEEGMNTILTSAPSWWGVAKEGNVEAAEAFLEWVASDAGQKILVEDAGCVSPFTDCKYVAADPFAPVLSSYIAEGRTSDWHWMKLPSGIGNGDGGLCYCFYRYAIGETDSAGFQADINQTLAAWYAKQ
ncbi:raffinose/stachyose/melibiose transport system substrate-binding protein [Pseudobutyrivibrio sp. YE44]|uniref:ABC transporter substrate-binding protein n=1 Tax=Pseudobutyrivibrio sp. YE44 TaxID=1520802 RepID=UPI00088B833A|nr:ABC transporter substrate-binding protein [Pseudobutyrivibrio sp. YE44]SDB19991.1 raffinose/stachyose/melibiose transport system substrate-binding protein [Pseudobutyrivibrio sp. YE44]